MPKHRGFNQNIARELILRAQNGNMDAFEHIYREFSTASFSLSFRICGQQAIAEDCVHEAFVKIMNNIKQFNNEGSFAGWCRRIVTFETINRVKHLSRLTLVGDNDVENLSSPSLFDSDWLANCIDLENLVMQLNPLSRAVFTLHEIEGYTHKEIAQMFGKSVSYSKVTLSRAYAQLEHLATAVKQDNKNASE